MLYFAFRHKGAIRYPPYRYEYRYTTFIRYTGIWTLHRYGQVVDYADSMHKVYGSILAFYQVSDFFFPGSWSKNKFLHVHAVDELHALCSSFTSTYATTICGWQIFSFLLNMQLFGLENSVPLHKRPRLKQKLYQLCIFFLHKCCLLKQCCHSRCAENRIFKFFYQEFGRKWKTGEIELCSFIAEANTKLNLLQSTHQLAAV